MSVEPASDERLTQAKQEVVAVYRKRAKRYNLSTSLIYNALGFRVNHHRRIAAEQLGLRQGDTVVEIGCGTGANFPFLEKFVGKEGRIIGVDLSTDMLGKASERVRRQGWSNVTLENRDGASFTFPRPTDGILSTFALTMIPEYDEVVRQGAEALSLGGCFVVMDFKMPSGRLADVAPHVAFLLKLYGGNLEMADRHPWESLNRHLGSLRYREFWLGMGYTAAACKPRQ